MPKRFMMTERCESGTYRERSVPIEGKYIPTHVSNARKAATSGHSAATPAEVPTAAAPMASAAKASMAKVESSVRSPAFAIAPNTPDPSRQLTMKHEKMVPYGVAPPPKARPTEAAMAGGHCRTKMYMAPSKRAWTPPTSRIRASDIATRAASRMVTPSPSPSPSPPPATSARFSCHENAARSAPAARKPTESSKGPDGPRLPAANAASCPATIATIASPAYAALKVSPSAPDVLVRCASLTSQASGAEKRRDVPMPPARRPSSSTHSSGERVESAPIV